MKIYGKENDYYDCAMAHGQDPLCVWTRKFKKIPNMCNRDTPERKLFNDLIEYAWRSPQGLLKCPSIFSPLTSFIELTSGYVFFCGKFYPFIRELSNGKTFYSQSSLENHLYANFRNKEVEEFLYGNYSWKQHQRDAIKAHFEQTKKDLSTPIEKLHKENNIPVYILNNDMLYEGGRLRDFDFFKVLDPYTCFQELNLYVSGVLGGQSPILIEIDDEHKIEGKGFDKVTSFRNMKRN